MPSTQAWMKMIGAGALLCIGGPALVMYVSPSEQELFKKYNPDLQRRSLENREQRQQDFDNYVTQLKEASKSDKPIWAALDDIENKRKAKERERKIQARQLSAAEAENLRQEIRASTQ